MKRNAIGWLALFVALGGMSFAASAHAASAKSCGTFSDANFAYRGAQPSLWWKVIIIHGPVLCSTALREAELLEALDSYAKAHPIDSPSWYCNSSSSTTDYCTLGRRYISIIGISGPTPTNPNTQPYYWDCYGTPQSSDGTEQATDIVTAGDTCSDALVVAREFMDSPSCAVNVHSTSDYDCRVQGHHYGYHCTGTIETAQESSIKCADDALANGFYYYGFTFKVVD